MRTSSFFLFIAMAFSLAAQQIQQPINLDSIHSIKQKTYEYINEKSTLSIVKESIFDTNKVLIIQQRYTYVPTDTGLAKNSHYFYTYNPKNQFGSHYTEKFPTLRTPNIEYSKQETQFKNLDTDDNRLWIKQYDAANRLLSETVNTYNEQKLRISTQTTDFNQVSVVSRIDNLERNNAGKMTHWESFDEDRTTLQRTKIRDMQWTYLHDTLLLHSHGYSYNNYNETLNSYDKKNNPTKTIVYTGFRQDNGKIIRENETITSYKKGKPSQTIIKKLGKKQATITYRYEPNLVEETTKSKEATTIKTTKEQYQNSKLIEHSELENNELLYSIQYQYADNKISRITEIEHKTSGDWKTVIEYNSKGNPTKKSFYIKNLLKQEDNYEYENHK